MGTYVHTPEGQYLGVGLLQLDHYPYLISGSDVAAMRRVSLVVFCGIPGSGKTHMVQNLVSQGLQVSLNGKENQCMQMLSIHYDEILPPDIEKTLIEKENTDEEQGESNWKQYRKGIVQCVETLVKALLEHPSPTLDPRTLVQPHMVDGSLWHSFVDCLSASISVFKDGMVDMTLPVCVLIDDNMYYSSMRYVYYQLAKKYTLSFCQIYLCVDLETALLHNNSRKVKVAEHTIVAMATKLEAPNLKENSWETKSFIVNGKPNLEEVMSFIRHSLDEPVQPIKEIDQEMINQSRVVCSKSFLYQSDLIIRKLVGEAMSKAKGQGFNSSALQPLASVIQTARRDLLASLHSGCAGFPDELVAMVTGDSDLDLIVLTQYLRDKFEHLVSGLT